MKEWVFGRNPVYEVLRAQRRRVFRLLVAEGVQEKGRIAEVVKLAVEQKMRLDDDARAR